MGTQYRHRLSTMELVDARLAHSPGVETCDGMGTRGAVFAPQPAPAHTLRDCGRHNIGETSRRTAPVSAATMHARPHTMSAGAGEKKPRPARTITIMTANTTTPTVASAIPRWRPHQLHARINGDGGGSDNTTQSAHAHKGHQSLLRRAKDRLTEGKSCGSSLGDRQHPGCMGVGGASKRQLCSMASLLWDPSPRPPAY